VGGLFADPEAGPVLTRLYGQLTGEPVSFDSVVEEAKRWVVEHGLQAEVHRLVEVAAAICHDHLELRDHTRRGLSEALVELLVAFPVYRAYVVPGEPPSAQARAVLDAALATARSRLPEERHDTLALLGELALGQRGRGPNRDDFVVRFQQTCGPVMAKGMEDTAFYRWHRLIALNEVGGDPSRFGVSAEEFHAFAARQQEQWPLGMTTLSTHDTKRSEDVRARLAVLAELSSEWAEAVRAWRAAAAPHRGAGGSPDPATEYLLWQTLVGTWSGGPLSAGRLEEFLTKAVREAKLHTTWTTPQEDYEARVLGFTRAVLADAELVASVGAFCELVAGPARVAVLGQKLVQLTMPGVPDVYQGTELVDLSLVDPDNRRPVDLADRRDRLARLDAGAGAPPESELDLRLDLNAEKLLVTSRALRLRRDQPGWFTGAQAWYRPLATSSGSALAFARGDEAGPGAVTVVTRLPVALERHGGWGSHTVVLPDGGWRDLLTGRDHPGGSVPLADLLQRLPVALLARAATPQLTGSGASGW
jgi:(1->4)-alpha-D-glucan 1-alpha-D-glucosylmutase